MRATRRPGTERTGVILVVAIVAATVLAGCDSGTDSSSSAGSGATSSASTAPSETPTPPAATGTEPPQPALDPLDWRTAPHHGQPIGLVRTRSGFFGIETQSIASLTTAGTIRWRYQAPNTDDFSSFVVDGVPVVSPVAGPKGSHLYRPHTVQGLDPRTGKPMWSHPSTGYTFADDARVYAPTCTDAPTGARGDCTITAYDPRSGELVWSTPTYADVELSQTGSGVLVVQTFPTGEGPRFVVLDASTGAGLGEVDPPRGEFASLASRTLVVNTPLRLDGARCTETVTGYSLDAEVLWSRVMHLPAGTSKKKPKARRCPDEVTPIPLGRLIGLESLTTRPKVLSAATGRMLSVGPPESRGAFVHAAAAGVVTLEKQSSPGGTLGLDPRSGEVRWTYPDTVGGWQGEGHYLTGNYLCTSPDAPGGDCAVVLDARTGEQVLHVPGVPEVIVADRDGSGAGLLTRIDDGEKYAAAYGYVTLP